VKTSPAGSRILIGLLRPNSDRGANGWVGGDPGTGQETGDRCQGLDVRCHKYLYKMNCIFQNWKILELQGFQPIRMHNLFCLTPYFSLLLASVGIRDMNTRCQDVLLNTTWKVSAPEGSANPHFFVLEWKSGLF